MDSSELEGLLDQIAQNLLVLADQENRWLISNGTALSAEQYVTYSDQISRLRQSASGIAGLILQVQLGADEHDFRAIASGTQQLKEALASIQASEDQLKFLVIFGPALVQVATSLTKGDIPSAFQASSAAITAWNKAQSSGGGSGQRAFGLSSPTVNIAVSFSGFPPGASPNVQYAPISGTPQRPFQPSTVIGSAPVHPKRRTCGVAEVHHRLQQQVENYRENRVYIDNLVAQHLERGALRAAPVTIPVVVHVVYNTADQNISDNQITSQIDALNRDYNKKNDDSNAVPGAFGARIGNPEISFALATRDPSGGLTTGVTRTPTSLTSFSTDDSVKSSVKGGADVWPADKYLNLWVCQLAGGLLGYAQFPGGPAETDGVVILHSGFGTMGTARAPFNLGRTAVHEVGHWLNLSHVWGDTNDCSGSDQVDDTPTQQLPNYGKPTFPHVSCNNGPDGDLFMDYMDYVDDAVMVMFTQGQVARMAATLQTVRTAIGT